MPDLPSLTCPDCGRALEYHVTVEMLDPPIGRVDTGYCQRCARLVERVRQTGTFYQSTLWQPLCRMCRQPVTFAAVSGEADGQVVEYRCRDHQDERWTWTRATDRWSRI